MCSSSVWSVSKVHDVLTELYKLEKQTKETFKTEQGRGFVLHFTQPYDVFFCAWGFNKENAWPSR